MINSPDSIVDLLLKQRGYTSKKLINSFLNPNYDRDLHDPYLLNDMEKACIRIEQALKRDETVAVYGDYDIDGLCATALLADVLSSMGLNTQTFIPDRFSDGYGLSNGSLKKLAKQGVNLIITVDCGSKSVTEVEFVNRLGVDVIVTDHHELGPTLPKAVAVINPKRQDSTYPFRDLAGCGVAFKLVQALQKRKLVLKSGQEKWLLDLVAFATVCDVVSLTDENRVLVQSGLKVWRRSRRIGLKALAKQAGISLENVTSTTLGFIIGPRINASGRLSHAKISLELIMTTDKVRADELANKLEELNTERRLSQKQIEIEAKIQVNKFENDEVLVLSSSNWPQGIIGIVASRLMENYQKPVFIMQELGLSAKGSARSFGDFSAVKALDSVKNLLTKGGGHDAAAGFTIKSKNIKAFRTKLNQYYNALKLKQQSKFLISSADMSLRLQDVSVALINRLRYLEPYGNGNLQPLFLFDNLKISEARLVGDDNSHLRLVLTDDSGQSITGIYFRFSLAVPKVGSRTAVIARLSINDFNNQLKTQLEVERLEEKLAKNASVVVE